MSDAITNSDFICLLQGYPSTDQEEIFNEAARRLSKLERQLDEAREQIKELIYIAERAIALAEIDFENDKFGVVSELRGGLERIKEGAK